MPETFGFGQALEALRGDLSVTRIGWNAPHYLDMGLLAQDGHSPPLPFIVIHTAQGELLPWTASQADLLADDWAVA